MLGTSCSSSSVTFSFAVEALNIFVGASTRGLLLSLGAGFSGSLALGLSLLLETGGLANRQHIVRVSLHGQLRISCGAIIKLGLINILFHNHGLNVGATGRCVVRT